MICPLPLAAALLLAGPPAPVPPAPPPADPPPTVAGRTAEEWAADLQADSRVVRGRAVLSLRAFRSGAATSHLIAALSNEDEAVRYWAAERLATQPTPGDGGALKETLQGMMQSGGVAECLAAAFALARRGETDDAVPTLIEGLDHPSRGVAVTAADFLARLGERASLAADDLPRRGSEPRRLPRPLPGQSGPGGGGRGTPHDQAGDAMNRLLLCTLALSLAAAPAVAGEKPPDPRPNILWISAEDISPDLGCYGDEYATTPTLDEFASQGAVYTRAFANAGVCAVARSCIITGMYPTAIGSQHMRSDVVPPPFVKCFPEYLRAAGYYTTNRSKTDYNFPAPPSAWDENGPKHRDWAGRAEGQPFFSVINLTVSHESKVRAPDLRARMDELLGDDRHDPAEVDLPPYIPDTPEARADRAQYYDVLTLLDREVKRILDRLAADGLADDTIVIFWGDHGVGLPRGKRWLYDSGLRVPLLVRWPGVVRPGTRMDELVSFVDFAPSMLTLAGVPAPGHMQGRAVFGPHRDEPREYVFAHRDRMDETYDLIRAVRDKRYKYVRNFFPERSRGQRLLYMDQGRHDAVHAPPARRRKVEGAGAPVFRTDQAGRGAVRHAGRPARGSQRRRRPGPRGDPGAPAGAAGTLAGGDRRPRHAARTGGD